MASNWLRYTWELAKLPEKAGKITPPVVVRRADKNELAAVQKVITSALGMDTGWADIHKPLLEKLAALVEAQFDGKEPLCVALQYGNRLIGCSVLTDNPEADSNLMTGPCILHEYRSRGFGTSLLGASLEALRDAGLKQATGLTRDKTTTGRYLYPKFGGLATPCGSDWLNPPRLAA